MPTTTIYRIEAMSGDSLWYTMESCYGVMVFNEQLPLPQDDPMLAPSWEEIGNMWHGVEGTMFACDSIGGLLSIINVGALGYLVDFGVYVSTYTVEDADVVRGTNQLLIKRLDVGSRIPTSRINIKYVLEKNSISYERRDIKQRLKESIKAMRDDDGDAGDDDDSQYGD